LREYIHQISKGKITTSRYVELAVERHLCDLKDKKEYIFDQKIAEAWIEFAQLCYHWKGIWAGTPIKLEDHQKFYFGCLMGWRKKNGLRRFRKSYKEVARKNAKTTEAAIKAIGHFLLDNVNGAQIYAGANKEEQARIVVNDAGRIIQASPSLKDRFRLFSNKEMVNRVVYPKTKSFMSAVGRDSKTQDGFDPSWGIIDEFHEAKDNKLLEVIESGMGARQDPLIDIITTAGFNKAEAAPCYSFRNVCIDVLEGRKEDDTLFAMIFAHENDSDWKDESKWAVSNPNIDVSVSREYLRARVKSAENEGGTTEVGVKTKNFNIWTNASDTWIQDEVWMSCKHNLSQKDLTGKKCYVGIDLAKKLDINAVTLFFPEVKEVSGKLINAVLCHFYVPKQKKDKDSDHLDYYKWINAGFINEIGDFSIDFRDLAPVLLEIFKKYDIQKVGFDRRYAYDGTIKSLIEAGYDCVEVIQNTNYLNLPTTELEKMAVSGTIEHFNNPVLRWMVSNVEIFTDTGGSIRPDKKRSTNKIDGVAALVNSIFVWLADKQEKVEPKIEWW